MESFSIHECIGGTVVDVELPKGLSLIFQDSGTGKSYMFQLLKSYFVGNGVPCALIDYHILQSLSDNDAIILAMCKGQRIVFLDNADLYITDDLIQQICSEVPYVMMSKKDCGLSYGDLECYRHRVVYEGNHLELRDVR